MKSQILDNFLGKAEQQSLNLLYIPNKGFKPLKFGEGQPPGADSVVISMCKMSGDEITEDNMIRTISVQLMPSWNPMAVLQKQLENYFMPALKGLSSAPASVQKLLNELLLQTSNSNSSSSNSY